MADAVPETTNYGFTRLGQGEPMAKNGWAFTDGDPQKLDILIKAALNHTHTGDTPLGDPTDPPTVAALPTGGTLASATTYFYRVSFVDQWGLETAASPEASAVTPDPITGPTAPAVTAESTGGTVGPGVYGYLITYADSYGGQSTPSPLASVQVLSGNTNRLRLDMPGLPTGATSFNIYRSRPGQSLFYYLGNATAAYYDVGTSEDQTITAPTTNTTSSTNSIQITVPLVFIPDGCFGWKIYRALASGDYDGNSLVHWVTEGISDTDTTPRTVWVDTGDALQAGFPPSTNACATSGLKLSYANLDDVLPLAAMPRGAQVLSAFAPGVVVDQRVVTVTEVPMSLQPTRFTAYFGTAPAAGATVRFRFTDSAVIPNYVEVACSTTTQGVSDPVGYFHVEYPLYLAETFEAEDGTRSATTVAVASDIAASSGQSVALAALNDYVQVDLGLLDPGVYQTHFIARVLQFAAASTNDLTVSIVYTATGALLGTATSFTLVAGTPDPLIYAERSGPTFTAPGGSHLSMRITKTTATTQAYNIDQMHFTATVPILAPGIITAQTFIDAPTTAADVNLALWF